MYCIANPFDWLKPIKKYCVFCVVNQIQFHAGTFIHYILYSLLKILEPKVMCEVHKENYDEMIIGKNLLVNVECAG